MKRFCTLLALFALSALPAAAQGVRGDTPRVERIVITEYGYYDSETAERVKDPSAPAGYRTTEVNIRNTERTNVIAGELETQFGFRFRVEGGPEAARTRITSVLRFPAPGLRDPSKPQPMLENRQMREAIIGYDDFEGYGFEYPWEIVKGVWTFEIWFDGKKMAEQKFTIQ